MDKSAPACNKCSIGYSPFNQLCRRCFREYEEDDNIIEVPLDVGSIYQMKFEPGQLVKYGSSVLQIENNDTIEQITCDDTITEHYCYKVRDVITGSTQLLNAADLDHSGEFIGYSIMH